MYQTVYHGSDNGELEIIEPRKSTHQKTCVYATPSKVVAFLFMGKGHGDLDTIIGTFDGKLCLVERRPGVLNDLYAHKGYLYELDGKSFAHYDYLWSKEVISFEPAKVIKKYEITNILDAINEEEKKGNIKVYRYPDRPSEVPMDNSDLIEKYKRFESQGLTGAVDDLLSIYPEFKERI